MKAKTFVSAFAGFLGKYSQEVRLFGSALSVLAGGIGLNRDDRAKVQGAIDAFETAAESIAATVESVKNLPAVKVDKKELEAAVKAALPDFIGGLSEAALRKLLEEKAK